MTIVKNKVLWRFDMEIKVSHSLLLEMLNRSFFLKYGKYPEEKHEIDVAVDYLCSLKAIKKFMVDMNISKTQIEDLVKEAGKIEPEDNDLTDLMISTFLCLSSIDEGV